FLTFAPRFLESAQTKDSPLLCSHAGSPSLREKERAEISGGAFRPGLQRPLTQRGYLCNVSQSRLTATPPPFKTPLEIEVGAEQRLVTLRAPGDRSLVKRRMGLKPPSCCTRAWLCSARCGHEALSGTVTILQNYFEVVRSPVALDVFTMIDIIKYVIYGIASAFFVYGILLMVEGFFTSGAIKTCMETSRSPPVDAVSALGSSC
ncbi:hypothetical protein KUCAC02_004041, partial [Chaenocephalus aceratus]